MTAYTAKTERAAYFLAEAAKHADDAYFVAAMHRMARRANARAERAA